MQRWQCTSTPLTVEWCANSARDAPLACAHRLPSDVFVVIVQVEAKRAVPKDEVATSNADSTTSDLALPAGATAAGGDPCGPSPRKIFVGGLHYDTGSGARAVARRAVRRLTGCAPCSRTATLL